jgi:hypothetical protein
MYEVRDFIRSLLFHVHSVFKVPLVTCSGIWMRRNFKYRWKMICLGNSQEAGCWFKDKIMPINERKPSDRGQWFMGTRHPLIPAIGLSCCRCCRRQQASHLAQNVLPACGPTLTFANSVSGMRHLHCLDQFYWTVFFGKTWGFHGGDYEEWRLLGCYGVWLL